MKPQNEVVKEEEKKISWWKCVLLTLVTLIIIKIAGILGLFLVGLAYVCLTKIGVIK